MTCDAVNREAYFGSPAWEAEPENAAWLARMAQIAAVRIATSEHEAQMYGDKREDMLDSLMPCTVECGHMHEAVQTMTKKVLHGQ